MRALCGIGGSLLIALSLVPHGGQSLPNAVARLDSVETQDEEDQPRKLASSREVLSATHDFQAAVNGKAVVRNRCHLRGNNVDVEEKAEVVTADQCKLVIKTIKVTHVAQDLKDSAVDPPLVEFTIHADLSELTTPILVEAQKFAQCDVVGPGVLKVSSRSDPKKPLQVIRRTQPRANAKSDEGTSQSRHDLGLFFADPAAARKAAKAFDRAVKACGGKEWPDEDDLP